MCSVCELVMKEKNESAMQKEAGWTGNSHIGSWVLASFLSEAQLAFFPSCDSIAELFHGVLEFLFNQIFF
jgi:hypothetical protein